MQLGFLFFALAIFLLDVLFGYLRGWKRGVIYVGTQILSALVAFFVAKALTVSAGNVAIERVKDTLANKDVSDFITASPEAASVVSTLAEALVAPIIFFLLYLGIRLVTWIIYRVVCAVAHIEKPGKKDEQGSNKDRWIGLGIGVVTGLIGIFVLMVPLFGYADLAVTALHSVNDSGLVKEEALGEAEQSAAGLCDMPLFGGVYRGLGEPMFTSMTTGKVNGEKVVLKNEISLVASVIGEVAPFAKKDISSYDSEEAAAMERVAHKVGESMLLRYTASAALRELATHWMAGDAFFGVARPAMTNNANIVMNGFLKVIQTSDADNIETDLLAFSETFSVCVDHGILSYLSVGASVGDFAEQVVKTEFLGDLKAVILRSPRMEPIYLAVTDLGMRSMINELGVTSAEDYAEKHPEMVEDIGAAVRDLYDDEGKVNMEVFSESVNKILEKNNVDLHPAAVELIADGLASSFTQEEVATMTNEEIKDRIIDRFGSTEAAMDALDKLQNSLGDFEGDLNDIIKDNLGK